MGSVRLKKAAGQLLFPVLSLLIALTAWQIAAAALGVELVLPSPFKALSRLKEVLSEGAFYAALARTLLRTLAAFALSLCCALVLALAGTLFGPLKKLVSPWVYIIRCLPTMAVVLLFVIWAGADAAPTAVTFLILFPILYSQFSVSLAASDVSLIETAKVFGAGRWAMTRLVYLPQLLPTLIDGMASGISLGLKTTVSAEILAQSFRSIGWLLQEAKLEFATARLMAITSVVVVVCMILEWGIRKLNKLIKW